MAARELVPVMLAVIMPEDRHWGSFEAWLQPNVEGMYNYLVSQQ